MSGRGCRSGILEASARAVRGAGTVRHHTDQLQTTPRGRGADLQSAPERHLMAPAPPDRLPPSPLSPPPDAGIGGSCQSIEDLCGGPSCPVTLKTARFRPARKRRLAVCKLTGRLQIGRRRWAWGAPDTCTSFSG
jgi:hypothetical protein